MEEYFGGPEVFVRRMHTLNFGVYQLVSTISVCETLFYKCASIHSRVKDIITHIQHANAHIVQWRHISEDQQSLPVKSTPSTLVSISSSPSTQSAKLCSIREHRSVQELDFLCIISRPMPISYTGGIFRRARGLCPSNAHPQLWCLSAPLNHLCLVNFVP